jgi:hypothetical protein
MPRPARPFRASFGSVQAPIHGGGAARMWWDTLHNMGATELRYKHGTGGALSRSRVGRSQWHTPMFQAFSCVAAQ